MQAGGPELPLHEREQVCHALSKHPAMPMEGGYTFRVANGRGGAWHPGSSWELSPYTMLPWASWRGRQSQYGSEMFWHFPVYCSGFFFFNFPFNKGVIRAQ